MGERAAVESVAERLKWLLAGRSPWKWGERVLLSAGAIGRMLKGSLPDPEKLVPAMRVENLSLNWLVDGQGAPYVVAMPSSDREASTWIHEQMNDSAAHLLLVYCAEGFTPVIHSRVEVMVPNVGTYEYEASTIIGGNVAGPEAIETMRRHALPTSRTIMARAKAVEVPRDIWHAIATGHASNYVLFGDDLKSGLARNAWFCMNRQLPPGMQEEAAQYSAGQSMHWAPADVREMLQLFTSLGTSDRDAAIRMLRGLAKPAN